jgi:hypothetical protein
MRYILLTVVLSVFLGLAADARTWTDIRGRHLEADFVERSGQKVSLRCKGKVLDVMLRHLSPADQAYVLQLGLPADRSTGSIAGSSSGQPAAAQPSDAAALRPENIMARMLAERKALEDDKAKTLAAKKAVFAQAKSKRAAKRCVT